MKIKKVISFLTLFLLFLSISTNICLAATNSSTVEATWYVGASGNGYVSGATNNAFHTLDKGYVYLTASCTNVSTKKQAYVRLYRQQTGFDKSFGTVYISSTATTTYTFPNKADKTSSKYYLQCGSGEDMSYHTLSGSLYN